MKFSADVYKKLVPRFIPRYMVVDQEGIIRYQGSGESVSPEAIRVAEALVEKSKKAGVKK